MRYLALWLLLAGCSSPIEGRWAGTLATSYLGLDVTYALHLSTVDGGVIGFGDSSNDSFTLTGAYTEETGAAVLGLSLQNRFDWSLEGMLTQPEPETLRGTFVIFTASGGSKTKDGTASLTSRRSQ